MSVHDRLPITANTRPPFASYPHPVALLLGTGDIPSAIARDLFLQGWGVILLRDPVSPVLRRGMAFDDALEDGTASLDGILAIRACTTAEAAAEAGARRGVVVANLDPAVFTSGRPGLASVLVDARMRKYGAAPDLRPLAACAIGIGPGFIAGLNVHSAVETLPGHEGTVIRNGSTATPTGKAVPLAGAGAERFIYAPIAGAWTPHRPLGAWLLEGDLLGILDTQPVTAPIAGTVRGMVRALPGVARGSKLVELDPRPDAPWQGVPPRAAQIAAGVRAATESLVRV